MKTKKTLLCIATMVMIIPFFLLLTFVLQKNSYDGDLVENYHEILTVQVKDGQADPESHSFQITFPKDGYYNYYMTWDVTDPGYNTALVVKDPNGEVVTLLTAYQTRELPNTISTVAASASPIFTDHPPMKMMAAVARAIVIVITGEMKVRSSVTRRVVSRMSLLARSNLSHSYSSRENALTTLAPPTFS